jgi:hypothetical protein
MEILKQAWKAIAAFLAVFVAQLVENIVTSNGTVVLPQTTPEWLTLLSTSFGGAVLVYLVRNKRTGEQIVGDIAALPVTEAVNAASDVVNSIIDAVPIPGLAGMADDVLSRLPEAVRANVVAKYPRA